jgi:hypothetical protein
MLFPDTFFKPLLAFDCESSEIVTTILQPVKSGV